MQKVFFLQQALPSECPVSLYLDEYLDMDERQYVVLTEAQFEGRDFLLEAVDGQYSPKSSDQCPDFCSLGSSLWACSERSWNWLSEIDEELLRVNTNVRVKQGNKQYRMYLPATIVDLVDHSASEFTFNPHSDIVTSARQVWFYEWEGKLPPIFRTLYRHEAFRVSPETFVTEEFVAGYREWGLTGVLFSEVRRSPLPMELVDGTFDPVVYKFEWRPSGRARS